MGTNARSRVTLLAALTAATLGVAGCSSDGGDAGSEGSSGDVVYRDADGECAAEPLEGIDYETASERIAYFEEASTGLPQTEPLPEPVDPSTTVAVLDNGSAVGSIIYAGIEQAAETAGVQLQRIDAGLDAQSVNTAVGSVVESAPDILISPAVDATFFQNHLEALEEAGTTVVYAGNSNAEQFGLLDSHSGRGASLVNGEVLAAAAITFTCGTSTEFVFYRVPEFSFSQVQLEAAEAYLEDTCPDCTLRVVDIPVATMDTTAGDAIVSDLQAHPETDFFITSADQMQIGLKAKQDLAGLDVPGMGQSSLPPNIEQIGSGLQAAGLAVDYNQYSWFMLDEGLRRHQGLEVEYGDWLPWVKAISRVITPATADEYPNGFVAYPGMADDFAALWGK
ncbi:sugar ABC transporter substrate-binding protein [Modestobacter roseus]|uniref:Ribose transport system substrate-binding protein n=1 Tax=Modestobacter roseus TaxID=1181884 RepID=A0A562IP86_9ACTN|nr:substrate-binding domain-containing protein [Modestobacter roseus]MQA34385.1 substrate-binding domain-containing protein [Modestobacter roseus]TWH72712.1 ribose transport system substrate-binding protein [Modestobacter roseus]